MLFQAAHCSVQEIKRGAQEGDEGTFNVGRGHDVTVDMLIELHMVLKSALQPIYPHGQVISQQQRQVLQQSSPL